MTPPAPPLYRDWTFWAVVNSVIAIVLSQIPPVHLLLQPTRPEVEVYSSIQVTHQVGNPAIGLFVTIGNRGGRELRVRGLRIEVWRDGTRLDTFPAQTYVETQSSESSVLFVPFSIKPGEHWSHGVRFLNFLDRKDARSYRENQSALNADISRKLEARRPKGDKHVTAEPSLVTPFLELFNKLFVWEPGEYVFALSVDAEPGPASYAKKYRFTLYESDTAELKKPTEHYGFGVGILYTLQRRDGVFVPLSEYERSGR